MDINSKRTLGIDVGFAIAGWAVVEKSNRSNKNLNILGYGVIETPKTLAFETRILRLYEAVVEIIEKFGPNEMAIEELFFFKNQKTVMKVGQARGAMLVAAMVKGLMVYNYTPLQVKQAVAGYGRASKEQVQKMVKMLFGMDTIPKPDDAADALAISFCHINSSR